MQNFTFTPSPETGRFLVHSQRTGRTYFVETIGNPHTQWGDLNPATKSVEGAYGNKYRGSIDKRDSVLTPENGFPDVIDLPVGHDPISVIEEMDGKLPALA